MAAESGRKTSYLQLALFAAFGYAAIAAMALVGLLIVPLSSGPTDPIAQWWDSTTSMVTVFTVILGLLTAILAVSDWIDWPSS